MEREPLDNWWPEEQHFLFYLDAYWGEKAKSFQIIQVINKEIEELIKKPVEDFMPESIRINLKRLLENAPDEESKKKLLKTQKEGQIKQKCAELEKSLDELKEIMSSEAFAKYSAEKRVKLLKHGR